MNNVTVLETYPRGESKHGHVGDPKISLPTEADGIGLDFSVRACVLASATISRTCMDQFYSDLA